VHQSQLDFLLDHRQINPSDMQATFINSKGFGGNNATAAILSPFVTETMLTKRHGQSAMRAFKTRQETVAEATRAYDEACTRGETRPIYRFGEDVVEGNALTMTPTTISIPGQKQPISLTPNNPYKDMV